MTAARLTRTYLAAPAHRARLVQNAAASAADAVFLDLEDAVPPAEKAAALESAANALTTHDWGNKSVAVRLNAIDSPTIEAEIKRLAAIDRLDSFMIPRQKTWLMSQRSEAGFHPPPARAPNSPKWSC